MTLEINLSPPSSQARPGMPLMEGLAVSYSEEGYPPPTSSTANLSTERHYLGCILLNSLTKQV